MDQHISLHFKIYVKNIPQTWLFFNTMVSTDCGCPDTVLLIYTVQNCSLPLKNGLIQYKLKVFLIVPSERLGPGARKVPSPVGEE